MKHAVNRHHGDDMGPNKVSNLTERRKRKGNILLIAQKFNIKKSLKKINKGQMSDQ